MTFFSMVNAYQAGSGHCSGKPRSLSVNKSFPTLTSRKFTNQTTKMASFLAMYQPASDQCCRITVCTRSPGSVIIVIYCQLGVNRGLRWQCDQRLPIMQPTGPRIFSERLYGKRPSARVFTSRRDGAMLSNGSPIAVQLLTCRVLLLRTTLSIMV